MSPRVLLAALLSALSLLLAGCPSEVEPQPVPDDDDDSGAGDDDSGDDDDVIDDDDSGDDDDSSVPSCVDDIFEENDADTSAAQVLAGSYAALQVCPGDDDWYSVTVASGDQISVDLAFLHAEGNIDLRLFDPSGALVGMSVGTTDGESVGPVTAAAGLYTIRVNLAADTGALPGNAYDLAVTVDTYVPTCTDDLFEENDSSPAAGAILAGSYTALQSCPSDEDWFSVALGTGDAIDVDVIFSHAEGNIDLSLYDPAGTVVALSSSTDDDEDISFVAAAAGPHLVRVVLTADSGAVPGNGYDLDVAVVEYVAPCTDDFLEDNDSQAAAAGIVAGGFSSLRSCPSDEDWFSVGLAAGDTLDVDLFFPIAEGNIDLSLYDPAGTLVVLSNDATDNEDASFVAAGAGPHRIRVTLGSDAGATPGNSYDMVVAVTAAPVCTDDAMEDNDSSGAAGGIIAGSWPALQACPADDDWYEILLADGDTIDVDVFFSDAEGDVDLRLLDPTGLVVALSVSADDDESVSWVTASAGLYAIRVSLAADSGATPGNSYSMDIGVIAACADDGFEDNDGELTPFPIAVGVFPDLGVCPSDDDWYSIDLLWGDIIDVDIEFADAEGDIDLELLDPSGTIVAQSVSSDDDEALTWTVAADGPYLVHVALVADQGPLVGNAYDMAIGIVPFTPTCFEDIDENNDTEATATQVVAGSYPARTACPSDDDYYAVDLQDGDTLDIDLTFSDAEGDVDVYVLDPSWTVVIGATSTTDDETLSWTATATGEHIVLVTLAADAGDPATPGNGYDMALAVTLAACADDLFEDNDSLSAPEPIGDGTFLDLGSCPLDEDWYAVPLLTGDEISVQLDFVHAEGDVDLQILDPSGAVLASATSITDDEALGPIAAATGGDFVIRVWLYADSGPLSGNTYDMTVTVGAAACVDDSFEQNDSLASAAAITAGALSALGICPADEDWYAIDLLIGDAIQVDLSFADAEGDVDLQILDPAGTVVDSSTTSADNESASWVATAGGAHLVRAWLYQDDGLVLGNSYAMDVIVAAAACADDWMEDNDSSAASFPIAAGSFPDLASCPGDEDWYSIDLLAGDQVTVGLDFADAEGDVDLQLRDPSGAVVASSTSTDDDESVSYTAATGGIFRVRAWLFQDDGAVLGNSYDMDVGVVLAPCVDDGYENNDNSTAATLVASGVYAGLHACPTDDDWYEVQGLLVGDTLAVEVLFADADGDIDVQLYGPSMNLLDSSTSTNDDEDVSATATAAGTHYVRVWLYSEDGPALGNGYEMVVTVGVAACAEDPFEDNDTIATAAPIGPGSHQDLGACPSDADWYSIDLSTNDVLTVDVLFSHAQGDIDLQILDPSGAQIGISQSSDDDESVGPLTITSIGIHKIKVWLFADSGDVLGNGYDLELAVVPFTPVCLADVFEDNDTLASAEPLAAATDDWPGLSACPADEDWYAVPLNVGDTVDFGIFFGNTGGDIDAQLYSPSGALLLSSTSSNDDEQLVWTAAVAGLYAVRIWLYGETDPMPGNGYYLSLTFTPAACADDTLEENDSDAAAVTIATGLTPGLTVCPADEDWYAVQLYVGDSIEAGVLFGHAAGDIDAQLYDPSGTLLDSSTSSNDDEELGPVTAATAGDYLVRVWLFGESDAVLGNDYDLDVSVVVAPCVDDAMEQNDSSAAPDPVAAGPWTGLASCPTDEDWYSISLLVGDQVNVALDFADAEGDIDLQLRNPAGTVVASSTSSDDDESVTHTAATGGQYLVRVWLYQDDGAWAGNDYDMQIGVVVAPCVEDPFENNDTSATAAPIAAGNQVGLRSCPTDDDWYSIDLGVGDQISVGAYFADAEGDIDLRLHNPSGALVASSVSTDDDEAVGPVTATVAGLWRIRVNLFSDAGAVLGNSYDMAVVVIPAAPVCAEDAWEQNDTSGAAAPVATGFIGDLAICPSDEDWYSIFLMAGDTLSVDAFFSHSEGDVDLSLYRNPAVAPLDTSTSSDDDESVGPYTATVSGQHYIRVWLFQDLGPLPGNEYEMQVSLTMSGCVDDPYENNDGPAVATPVVAGPWHVMETCPGDDDWYEIDLAAGQVITVDLAFADAEGDIDLELYDDSALPPVASSLSTDDDEQVVWTAAADGPHLVRVWLVADAGPAVGNGYDMDITLSAAPCVDDPSEDNDTQATAAVITEGNASLTACPADEDWFGIYLVAGDGLEVDLTFSDAEGDIDLQILDPTGNIEASSSSTDDDESAGITADETGMWLIRAWLFLDAGPLAGNTYDASAAVLCADDIFEDNDSSAALAPTPPSFIPELRLCASEEDWYGVNVQSGDFIAIDLAFAHAEGDLDLGLYDQTGTMKASSTSSDDDESLTFTADSSGLWRVLVTRYGPDTGDYPGSVYDMDLEVSPAAAYCATGDFFDPNEDVATAAEMLPGIDTYYGLSLCNPGDIDDYFGVSLAAGEELDVDIFFSDAVADVDLFIEDASGGLLAASTSADDDESVTYAAAAAEVVYIHVDLWSGASNTYDMVVDVVQPELGLLITEVMYDPLSGDAGEEWVELYNGTSSPIDLSGYSIGGGGTDYTYSKLQLTGTMNPGACWVVGGPTSNADNANPVYDLALDIVADLQNSDSTADGVAVFDVTAAALTAATVPIDAVLYGLVNTNNLMGPTGAPSPVHVGDAPNGSSIERLPASWQIQATPSPGDCSHAL